MEGAGSIPNHQPDVLCIPGVSTASASHWTLLPESQNRERGTFAMWKKKFPKFKPPLLQTSWTIFSSPLRAPFPEVLVIRNNYFSKSLLLYFQGSFLADSTKSINHQPSPTDRICTQTVKQFTTQKTHLQQDNVSVSQDTDNSLTHDIFPSTPTFTLWLRRAGKGPEGAAGLEALKVLIELTPVARF